MTLNLEHVEAWQWCDKHPIQPPIGNELIDFCVDLLAQGMEIQHNYDRDMENEFSRGHPRDCLECTYKAKFTLPARS